MQTQYYFFYYICIVYEYSKNSTWSNFGAIQETRHKQHYNTAHYEFRGLIHNHEVESSSLSPATRNQ